MLLLLPSWLYVVTIDRSWRLLSNCAPSVISHTCRGVEGVHTYYHHLPPSSQCEAFNLLRSGEYLCIFLPDTHTEGFYNWTFPSSLLQLNGSPAAAEIEMPAMQREKSASLSETDYAALQKDRAVAEAKAIGKEEPTTNTTASSPAAGPKSGSLVAAQRPRNAPTKRSANDFRFGKMIGEGSFSTVFLAKDIHTSKECASEYSTD